jgi:hypothetical protein
VTPGSPGFSGYVDAGALELYCERHGDGHPLVLLHGAFGTIESCFSGLLPALARHFEVIAVDSILAASIPSPRRHSSRSTRTSSTVRPGTRRTAGSRPSPVPGLRSWSS